MTTPPPKKEGSLLVEVALFFFLTFILAPLATLALLGWALTR